MSTARDQAPPQPTGLAYVSSLVALALGVLLAVGVSAGVFGFAVLLFDSVAGLVVYRMSRRLIDLAEGDQARWLSVYTLLGAVITLPTVLLGTYLLAIAAGHRLGEPSRRWILLGMAIYAVVRAATVLASTPAPELNMTKGAEAVTGATPSPPPAATPPAAAPSSAAGPPVPPRPERR